MGTGYSNLNSSEFNSSVSNTPYVDWFSAAAICLLEIVVILFISNSSISFIWKLSLSAALIAVGVWLCWRIFDVSKSLSEARKSLQKLEAEAPQHEIRKKLVTNYQSFLKDILPLWQRQTELAQHQLETSINELLRFQTPIP